MKKIGITPEYNETIYQTEIHDEKCIYCGHDKFISVDCLMGLICEKCIEESVHSSSEFS